MVRWGCQGYTESRELGFRQFSGLSCKLDLELPVNTDIWDNNEQTRHHSPAVIPLPVLQGAEANDARPHQASIGILQFYTESIQGSSWYRRDAL